jgi:hypothetical protein
MAILKRYAGKKFKKSQFPASTAKVGLRWVRLATETLRHREEVRGQISEVRRKEGGPVGEGQRSDFRSQKERGRTSWGKGGGREKGAEVRS